MDHGASRKGKRGRISKLAEPVKKVHREIISRCAFSWTRLSENKLWEELKKRGLSFSTRTAHEHLKLLEKRRKKASLKPTLSEQSKTLRVKCALAQVSRSHGRGKLRFKGSKRAIMVDESWLYLTSDAVTAMLIEEMDALIHPKAQRKSHMEKTMLLAALGQPQRVIWKGE